MIKNKTTLKLKRLLSLEQIEKDQWNYFWSILALGYIANFFISVVSSVLSSNILGFSPNNTLNKYSPDLQGSLFLIFSLLVVAPITEEFLTRFLLSNIIWTQFIGINLFFLTFFNWQLSLLVLCFTIFRMFFTKPFYSINYWIIFISSAIFAIMHLNNFTNLKELGILTYIFTGLIIILPQLLLGLLLAFTRIKLGIKYSILQHGFINLPPATIIFVKLFSGYVSDIVSIFIFVCFMGINLILPLIFIFSSRFCKYQERIG